MLQAVEAEVDENGQVRLQEPLILMGRHRAVLTILEPVQSLDENAMSTPGGGGALLKFLEENRMPPESRLSADEIDAQIQAEREAWD